MSTNLKSAVKFVRAGIRGFYSRAKSQGAHFTAPPTELQGQVIARLRDVDGAETSVGGS
jgi:hypothetical protein